jgi:hypothetical protein
VLSTHDVELALARAEHVLVLRRGEVLGAGPPPVFADPVLREEGDGQPRVRDGLERIRVEADRLPAVWGAAPGVAQGQGAHPLGRRVSRGDVQLRPQGGGGDVERGVLPDRAPGAAQAPDVEAVELDEVPGAVGGQVALGRRLALGGRRPSRLLGDRTV